MEEEMRSKLASCFDRLQTLDITPTLQNMEKLVQTLYELRDVYNDLGGDNGGEHTADPDGRDNS